MIDITNLIRKRQEKDANADPKEVIKQYSILKKKGFLDVQTWKYKLRNKYHPLSTVKVNMQLTNGEVMPFVVNVKEGGFVFDNGFYIIDERCKYFDNNAKMWCFDYHEELTFPIDKRINITDTKNQLYGSDDVELETAINPKSLQKFMESTVIQKLLAGAEMEDSLRKIKVMIILILIGVAISLLLNLNMSGLLS